MKTFSDFGISVPANATGNVHTTCPKCSPQRKKSSVKCLSVNVDEGVWCCHHCNDSGTLKVGRDEPRELHWRKPKYRAPEPQPVGELPAKVVGWFGTRGITPGVLERNQIGFGRVYMPQEEDFVDAVNFPYFRETELVNRKYRDGKKNFRMEAGAERILYGLNDLHPERTIIVEGEIDKLSVEVAGYRNCVSVPDGAPSPASKDYASKFSFLESAKQYLEAVGEFVLAVDNDEPGKTLEDELARRLGRERCRRVTWPADCKDANEVLVKYGPARLAHAIETAEAFPIHGAFDVLDRAEGIRRLYQLGFERGQSTGWPSLDEHYTVRPGELTIVTGIPGSGKSNWLDALLVNLARLHGWGFALFSPENQPIEDHMARVVEKYERAPMIDGPTAKMAPADLERGMTWANRHFTWILPSEDADWQVEAILGIAKQLVFRKGIRGLVIDPWNELEHMKRDGENETEYASRALKRLRQFARTNGVHVWLVVHPAKLYREKDGRYPVPTLYDCSGSANFRNKADNGLVIWRDLTAPKSREIDVHVQKIRFRQIGRLGMVPLDYEPACATYRDPKNDDLRSEVYSR